MAIVSLIAGIVAILMCTKWITGIVISAIALILAIIAVCIKDNNKEHHTMRQVGLALAVAAMIVSSIMTTVGVIDVINQREAIKESIAADQAYRKTIDEALEQLDDELVLKYAEIYASNHDADTANDVSVDTAKATYNALLANYEVLKTAGYTVDVSSDYKWVFVKPAN